MWYNTRLYRIKSSVLMKRRSSRSARSDCSPGYAVILQLHHRSETWTSAGSRNHSASQKSTKGLFGCWRRFAAWVGSQRWWLLRMWTFLEWQWPSDTVRTQRSWTSWFVNTSGQHWDSSTRNHFNHITTVTAGQMNQGTCFTDFCCWTTLNPE